MSSSQNGHIQISPLARAYLAAVRAGQVTEDSPERQLQDAASYILRWGISGCTADVLRVVAALCEAVAEMKEERTEKGEYDQDRSRIRGIDSAVAINGDF